ncbi:hypothetical protein JKP75_08920 [Blastococcus sp. TML/M2B]|uniref:hypothetical protein n=1 Tax=unclassified Blastococcus TaxID=2619396 RepID=UPI00190B9C67|nr:MULTISPECIES: hypothetical protein [unclassified Blastococcus]MBN1092668.1 hypothetical protein [Blastococcus sp. TML/M2B]MBN1097226.1 hypothetical protein [Blastococcus sp. TML/C7B]
MPRSWTHVGRCWSNGEPFLALDGDLLPGWSGQADGDYERLVPDLDYELTSIAVGSGRAALVLTDAEVGDEGWLEVFRADDDAVAVLQVSADDYPAALTAALAHPEDDGDPGDHVPVPSGRLAFISAALDGAGPDAAPLRPEAPRPLPESDDYDERQDDAGGPLLRATAHGYRIWVRWMTPLDGDAVFARWLLVPASGDIPSQ